MYPSLLTVIVIDNAPIHTNKAFKAKIVQWRQNKLEIFWLPTYSPHLNLSEILWRFMKYEWVETKAYSNWKSLICRASFKIIWRSLCN